MLFKSLAVVAAAATTVLAQNATNTTSICDKYTTALLMNNTADNQYTLIKLLVNTAAVGNFSAASVKPGVQGILNATGVYYTSNGTKVPVNLVPYFDGGLYSTNRNNVASSVNFLDGGGAAPVVMNMPAFANATSSNQYILLTHLYSYFGVLLGCSQYGVGAFPAYGGSNSQYNVHKYMDLNPYQMGYFIQEVAASARSFGVSEADITAAGGALTTLFDARCAAPTTVVPSGGAMLQAMCIDSSCPLAANATCSMYDEVIVPLVANTTLAMGEGSNSTTTIVLIPSGATTGSAGPAATAASGMLSSGSNPNGATSTAAAAGGSTATSSAGAAAQYTPAFIGAVAGAAALVYGAM